MHRRGRVAASVNPHPPNAGDGGARAATSFVTNSKRSEDAEDEPPALEDAPSIITLHPAMLDHYIRTVDALAAALADHAGAEDDRGSLVGNFRALVHSVRTRDR